MTDKRDPVVEAARKALTHLLAPVVSEGQILAAQQTLQGALAAHDSPLPSRGDLCRLFEQTPGSTGQKVEAIGAHFLRLAAVEIDDRALRGVPCPPLREWAEELEDRS